MAKRPFSLHHFNSVACVAHPPFNDDDDTAAAANAAANAAMQNNDPIGLLLAQYPLPAVIYIFKVLAPYLNEQGRACLPVLESDLASRSSSRLSTSTWSSARSFMSATFDRSPSGMAFSDASSIAESSHSAPSGYTYDQDRHYSNSSNPQLAVARKGHGQRAVPVHRISKPTHKAIPASVPSPLLCPRKPSFECPFCWELEIPSSISRKADLKRHFKQFHQNNAQWVCPERGCGMAFDWRSAFEMHLKEAHRNAQHSSDTAMVKLCRQTVFACGFSNCRLVFEAATDDEAEKKAQEYFNHVANHFDDNLTHRNWSYTVRIRNLMRQASVDVSWKERKKGTQDPKWQPHTSSVVRKILETRHFSDIPLLVQWVVFLGSNPFCEPHSPIPKLPGELRLPVKEHCNSHRPSLIETHHHMAMDPPATIKVEPDTQPPEPEDISQEHEQGVHEHDVHKHDPGIHEHDHTIHDHDHVIHDHDHGIHDIDRDHDHGLSVGDVDVKFAPPTPSQHSESMLSPFNLESSFTAFQHDSLISQHMDTPSISAAAVVTANDVHPSMTAAQPLSHWLGMTTASPGIPLQSQMDAVIHGYSQPSAASNFRPMTPGQQMMTSGMFSLGMSSGQPPPTITPMDLEMTDCHYEPDRNCF